jgi:hypothetical protein
LKIRFLLALLGLAISFALPTFAQEKEEAKPFHFGLFSRVPKARHRERMSVPVENDILQRQSKVGPVS